MMAKARMVLVRKKNIVERGREGREAFSWGATARKVSLFIY